MQHTHFASDGLFCTKQTLQLHPAGALKKSLRAVEEDAAVEEEEWAEDCVEVSGDFCTVVEAKPEQVMIKKILKRKKNQYMNNNQQCIASKNAGNRHLSPHNVVCFRSKNAYREKASS